MFVSMLVGEGSKITSGRLPLSVGQALESSGRGGSRSDGGDHRQRFGWGGGGGAMRPLQGDASV